MLPAARASLVLLLLAASSGCVGGGESSAERSESVTDSPEPPAETTRPGWVTFRSGEERPAYNATLADSGTFAGPPTCPLSCTEDHQHALPDGLPAGVVTQLDAVMKTETTGILSNWLTMDLVLDDGETIRREFMTDSEGRTVLRAWFQIASGSGRIVVDDFAFHEQAISYSLDVSVWADVEVVHPFAPVAFHVAPGSNVTIQPVAGPSVESAPGPAAFALFDASDEVLMRAKTDDVVLLEIGPNAAGEYVLVPAPNGASLRISTDGDVNPSLRQLTYQAEFGAPHPMTGPIPITWAETLDQPVVTVGIYASYTGSMSQASGDQAKITSPAGVVLDEQVGCGLGGYCLYAADVTFIWWAEPEQKAITTGEYKFDFTQGASNPGNVGRAALYYIR